MNSLFNYSTLNVTLFKSTRTLNIQFKKDYSNINLEILFELESILAWASNKVEIRSILLNSENDMFCEGIDKAKLKDMNSNKINKMTSKLQKIVYSMLHLPQTIVVDIGMGAFDLGTELTLGADIRISQLDPIVAFNHNRIGLTPSSGGIGLLQSLIGQSMSRNWLLLGSKIKRNQLIQSGFLYDVYDNESRIKIIQELLQEIYATAPIQRIQTKLGLLEARRENLEKLNEMEKKLSEAAMVSEDWKDLDNEDFMPAKNMGQAVKLSIVEDNSEI